MACRYLHGPRTVTIPNCKSLWTEPAVLLLACTTAVLLLTGSEARNLQTSRPELDTFERRLQSVDLPADSANEGWTLGRASFYGPSDSFSKQFNYTFNKLRDGDCGWYNGADSDDTSALTVPIDMVAALATGNSDFPGSCGRCYELRCVNNVIPGNYSSDGMPIPFTIAEMKPVYTLDTYSSKPAVDDYNRPFPGNVLDARNQLFTQCWNNTDAQGLLSPSGSIIVQVTDSCTCLGDISDACCTNIPHFNLGYQAFQKLAHPDYWLMDLMFRPVYCSSKKALPLEPGFVSETIYKDQVGSGWGVGGSAIWTLQEPKQGLSGSNASCFDLQTADDFFFFCRECDRPGYQPFLLSNTSGLELFIKQTSDTNTQDGLIQIPDITMTMGYMNSTTDGASFTQLCTNEALDFLSQFGAFRKDNRGMRQVSTLFQNSFRSCIPILDQVTSFRFQSNAGQISFCMDNISLLPSTLQPAGSGRPMPNYTNCKLIQPQLIDQDGKYVAGVPSQPSQNVSGYTLFPFADLPDQYDLSPVLGTCSTNNSGSTISLDLMQQVNNCTGGDNKCCYHNYDATTDDQESASGLPDTLAQICNNMATNGSICQGFVYDSFTKTAYFKGGPPQAALDDSKLCLHPNITVWLLSAALQSELDSRSIAGVELEAAKPACSLSPQPSSNQDLQNLARDHTLSADVKHDVAANGSDASTAYSLTSYADLQDYQGLTCSVLSNTSLNSLLRTCASLNNGTCCVDYGRLSSSVDSAMPDALASVCNNITFANPPASSSRFCQGFVYDDGKNIAFFKPQPASGLLDTSSLCSSPTAYTWLRTQATTGATAPPVALPAPISPGDSTGSTLKTVWGVLAAVATGSVTAITWFAVTYSYRTDKRMVVTEVVKHLKVADIASAAVPAQAATSQQGMPTSKTPVVQTRNLQKNSSGPSRQLLMAQSSSSQSSDFDAVQNPLLLVPGSSHATMIPHKTGSIMNAEPMAGPSNEMKAVAKQITVRCLRRWDGFLGIRARSDGIGRRSGIWKDKFDGVHYAVLLLAMHRLNETLNSATPEPSSIQAAWQQGDHKQHGRLLNQLVRVLQNVTEEEAQALPDKDPEVPGMYDKLCSMMVCCRS